MLAQDPKASAESDIADMEVKLVYRDREVPALLNKDFLESTVEFVKLQIVQFKELAPINEPINELALYLRLPMKEENEMEELVDSKKMLHYLDKLSCCTELRIQKRSCSNVC
jgi:hypothetical protein